MTEFEFTQLAKHWEVPEYHDLRQIGKNSNFGLLFSASARTFAESFLTSLSPKEAAALVDSLNLKALQVKLIREGKIKSAELNDEYFKDRLTLATFIRDGFRKAYPGLVKLAERRQHEAITKGYVRCTHGAVRRLPLMMLKGKHDAGNKELFTYFSISINSPVQNFESTVVAYYTGYKIWKWLIDNDMKSRFFNFVHDSFDMYIHKDEAAAVAEMSKKIAEEQRPEYGSVHMAIDGTFGDYYEKGELWKTGTDMEAFVDS